MAARTFSILFCFFFTNAACTEMLCNGVSTGASEASSSIAFGAIMCLSDFPPHQCAGSSLLWASANADHGVYNADPPREVTSQCKVTQTAHHANITSPCTSRASSRHSKEPISSDQRVRTVIYKPGLIVPHAHALSFLHHLANFFLKTFLPRSSIFFPSSLNCQLAHSAAAPSM